MKPIIILLALAAAAQQPRYEVKRAPSKITVDGRLDDAAWRAAAPAVEFVFPWANQTGAKQKTTARLLWDNDNLYIAYQCEDADVTAHYDQRDDPTYKDDAVEFFVNPKPSQAAIPQTLKSDGSNSVPGRDIEGVEWFLVGGRRIAAARRV